MTCERPFSLSTIWILDIEPRSSGLGGGGNCFKLLSQLTHPDSVLSKEGFCRVIHERKRINIYIQDNDTQHQAPWSFLQVWL